MTAVHAVLGIAATTLFAAAGLLGAWRWWRGGPSPAFWRLLRAAQATLVVDVALGGALLLAGRRPSDNLHYLYGLLPLAVGFVAEQLRLASAQTVLDARGLPDAQAVGRLPADDQRSVVLQIVRRELGVMAAAALVIAFLAVRALATV
jgi:hypothetical protein